MRAWGLAKGLVAKGVDVTIAINASFPQKLLKHDGISLVNWSADEQFVALINSYDSVIVSYCMGSDSVFIADHINDDVQLILDVYVPIYVEVSARESKDIDSEYSHYMDDVSRYNHVLRRGDYFLCSSETQKTYYTGVLSALGIINPRTYREDRIIIAPFGIHNEPAQPTRNPYKKLGVKDGDFLVLWFGGLYPWFQIDEFLATVKKLSSNSKIKFAIVGGKNPFNPNPDFSRQYEVAVKFAKDNSLFGKSLIFVDWVDYEDRINWYGRAQVVISINKPGDENGFAWRTRVMDYVWGELPILTNAGDPLGEQLLATRAAIRLDSLSEKSMSEAILDLVNSKSVLPEVKTALVKVKKNYYWDKIMGPVASVVQANLTPSSSESKYRKSLGIKQLTAEPPPAQDEGVNLRNPFTLSRKAFSYARRKGIRRSANLAYRIGRTQFRKKTKKNHERNYVFISHPIDNTGAPQVLVKIVEEYAEKYGANNVRVIAPGILPHLLKRLQKKGVRVDKAALGLGDRLIDLQLGLNKNDFLLMNTLAIYPNYRDFIMRALASGRINHAYWFIHEDTAQIPYVARDLSEEKELEPLVKHAKSGRLTLLVPAKKIKKDYEKLWNIKGVKVVHHKVDVPKKYKHKRPATDYAKLNFLLSGSPSDGRKGQLLALSAFYYFVKNFQDKAPANYRNFKLSLVGIGDDYVSQQIKTIGASFLDKKLRIFPSVPHEESLKITSDCNATICCSLNETFGLYIAEGMFMGHLILRNNSAGMEEQLKDGVNGYYIETTDIKQFSSLIEKLLNKKTTNEQLQKMGQASQGIIAPYADYSYVTQIEKQ